MKGCQNRKKKNKNMEFNEVFFKTVIFNIFRTIREDIGLHLENKNIELWKISNWKVKWVLRNMTF